MEYYVYENWRDRPKKAKVHLGICKYCKFGTGLKGGTRPDNGKWSSAFSDFEDAWRYANSTGLPPSTCKKCNPK